MLFMKVYQIIYYIGYFYFHLVEYVVLYVFRLALRIGSPSFCPVFMSRLKILLFVDGFSISSSHSFF